MWNDVKDDQRKKETFSLDDEGHFLVGAAIGIGGAEVEVYPSDLYGAVT